MVLKLGKIALYGEVLDIGLLGSSSICKVVIALGAVPVLEVAVCMARSDSLVVNELDNCFGCKILAVGELSACCISINSLALYAVPVFSRTCYVASLCCGNVRERANGLDILLRFFRVFILQKLTIIFLKGT